MMGESLEFQVPGMGFRCHCPGAEWPPLDSVCPQAGGHSSDPPLSWGRPDPFRLSLALSPGQVSGAPERGEECGNRIRDERPCGSFERGSLHVGDEGRPTRPPPRAGQAGLAEYRGSAASSLVRDWPWGGARQSSFTRQVPYRPSDPSDGWWRNRTDVCLHPCAKEGGLWRSENLIISNVESEEVTGLRTASGRPGSTGGAQEGRGSSRKGHISDMRHQVHNRTKCTSQSSILFLQCSVSSSLAVVTRLTFKYNSQPYYEGRPTQPSKLWSRCLNWARSISCLN